MSSVVHAVFPKHKNLAASLETLNNAGFSARQFVVVGQDSDSFRDATASLHVKKVDELVIGLALVGLVFGALAGFVGSPLQIVVTPLESTFMSLLVGTTAGGLLGALTGCLMSGALRIDEMPVTEAKIKMGRLSGGETSVSVSAADIYEAALAKAVFIENEATYLSTDFPDEADSTRTVVAAGA